MWTRDTAPMLGSPLGLQSVGYHVIASIHAAHASLSLQELLDEHAQKLEKYKDSENVFDPSCFHWTPRDYPIYTWMEGIHYTTCAYSHMVIIIITWSVQFFFIHQKYTLIFIGIGCHYLYAVWCGLSWLMLCCVVFCGCCSVCYVFLQD